MKTLVNIGLVFFLSFLMRCEKIQFNPNEIILEDWEKNQTDKNIAKVNTFSERDTITFALFGDSQRYYQDSDNFVADINAKKEVQFVIHTGDISDFGLPEEFHWMNKIYRSLTVPLFTVIGNHDMVANGKEMYKQTFGEFDYSFTYSGFKFIFINTNGTEFSKDGTVPDISWLDGQLRDTLSYQNALIIAHVPVFNNDFDKNLIPDFLSTIDDYGKSMVTLNGHHHDFGSGVLEDTNISYINSFSVSKRKYVVVTATRSGDYWFKINSF